MLSELSKPRGQMEMSLNKYELKAANIQEVSKALEANEVISKEFTKGTEVLKPDMEIIKTQSLESVKQNNLDMDKKLVKEDNENRKLTEAERQSLQDKYTISRDLVENIRIDSKGVYVLPCRNEGLAGKKHEITGIPFKEKDIILGDIKLKGVFPEFPASYTCDIPKELYKAGDREIFKNCTEQLRDFLKEHPEVQAKFREQQLQQIHNGEPYIKGYTWHHSEVPGKMQLVETKVHALSGHTGGNSIWCGGIR